MGIRGLRVNHLHADVVVQVDHDGRHEIRRGAVRFPGAYHCRAENILADDGRSFGAKADFADFVIRQLELKILVDSTNGQKNEAEVARIQALKEHQRFEPRLFQKDEVAMIFEARQSRRKAEQGFGLVFKFAKEPGPPAGLAVEDGRVDGLLALAAEQPQKLRFVLLVRIEEEAFGESEAGGRIDLLRFRQLRQRVLFPALHAVSDRQQQARVEIVPIGDNGALQVAAGGGVILLQKREVRPR